jgi:CheY-like chemotaxis protein
MPTEPNKTILLVEDSVETQLIFKVFLKDKYLIDVSGDAEEAISKIDSNRYDLIILDINLLGDLDGNDVLRHIRKTKNERELPVVVVTAYAMKGDREKFIALGANDYLPKPIDKTSLLDKVQSLIG